MVAKYTENATCHFATTVQGVCGGSQCSASVVFAHPSRHHPFGDGHLGCFCRGAVVNQAAKLRDLCVFTLVHLPVQLLKAILLLPDWANYEQSCHKHLCATFFVCISFQLICVDTKVHARMAHMGRGCLVLWQTAKSSPKVAAPFCVANSHEGESLHLMLSLCWILAILVVVTSRFNLRLPKDIWCWTSFHCLFTS